jgi:hypothetical protein
MPVIINGTTGVTFPNGVTMSDGTSAPVTVAQGGTGANTAANARTALGTNDAANITTGALAIANGGTGQTTRQAAMDALAGAVTAGRYLRGDGTDVIMDTLKAADMTGTLAVANGGTGTTTPSLVGGTNITISGTWPNQTVTAAGGGVTSLNGQTGAITNTNFNVIGSYVLGTGQAGISANSTYAGSNIGVLQTTSSGADNYYLAYGSQNNNVTGTWRAMSGTTGAGASVYAIFLAVRIS